MVAQRAGLAWVDPCAGSGPLRVSRTRFKETPGHLGIRRRRRRVARFGMAVIDVEQRTRECDALMDAAAGFSYALVGEHAAVLPWLKDGIARALADGDPEGIVHQLEWLAENLHSRAAVIDCPGAPHPVARVGRNATCPCGSGRKYRHCYGR
jgi:hypothetical protein